MTVSEFLAIEWGKVEGPLIEPPRFTPIVADPSFLFPEETPGGDWQLFAHSAWGIHRYSSVDGISWRPEGLPLRNAMRPFLRRLDTREGEARGEAPWGAMARRADVDRDRRGDRVQGSPGSGASYLLFYESYPPLALPLTALPFRRKWRSCIKMSRSMDLVHWSRGETLIEADLPWTRDPALGKSVSNPCLVRDPRDRGSGGNGGSGAAGCAGKRSGSKRDGAERAGTEGWRLYFSASLVWVPDCGFCEPRYIACALGGSPSGPFRLEPAPIVDPDTDPLPGVLGAGSMKVMALDDGWIGLQNKIYRSPSGESRSAIFLLRSDDGFSWRPAAEEALVAPAPGWTASHVYACDCRLHAKDGLVYLYFNARDGWRVNEGVERIGRIVGRPRA
jgi:hypothetical protein